MNTLLGCTSFKIHIIVMCTQIKYTSQSKLYFHICSHFLKSFLDLYINLTSKEIQNFKIACINHRHAQFKNLLKILVIVLIRLWYIFFKISQYRKYTHTNIRKHFINNKLTDYTFSKYFYIKKNRFKRVRAERNRIFVILEIIQQNSVLLVQTKKMEINNISMINISFIYINIILNLPQIKMCDFVR